MNKEFLSQKQIQKPRRFREIFKDSWEFFKENFSLLALIVLIIEGPIALLSLFSEIAILREIKLQNPQIISLLSLNTEEIKELISKYLSGTQNLGASFWIVFISGMIFLIFLLILESIVLLIAIKKKIESKKFLIKSCFKEGILKFFSYLWVNILVFLAFLGGLILLIIPGVIFYIWFVFAALLVIFEDLKGRAALKRSYELTKGYFWKILGNLTLTAFIVGLGTGILGVLGNISFWFFQPIFSLTQSIIIVLFLVFLVFLYFEIKKTKESTS